MSETAEALYGRIYKEIARKERERIEAKLRYKIRRQKECMISGALDARHSGGKIDAWFEVLTELEAEGNE